MPFARVYDWEALYIEFYKERKPKGMTQEQFAKEVGCHVRTMGPEFRKIFLRLQRENLQLRMTRGMGKALDRIDEALSMRPGKAGMKVQVAKLALEAVSVFGEVSGLTPKAAVNVQTNVSVPLFDGQFAEEANRIFEEENGNPTPNPELPPST